MVDTREGLLHLLGRNLVAVCGNPFGLLTTSVARCNCATCLSLWEDLRDSPADRPLAGGEADEVTH